MNRPLGEGMSDVPYIPDEIMFYWDAYQDLSTERPSGGFNAIPYMKILAYAKEWKSSVQDLKMIIWAVDDQYLDYWKSKSENESQSSHISRGNGVSRRGR